MDCPVGCGSSGIGFLNRPKPCFFPRSGGASRKLFRRGTSWRTARIGTTSRRLFNRRPTAGLSIWRSPSWPGKKEGRKPGASGQGIAFEHSSSREEFLARLNDCIAHVKQTQCLTTDTLIRRLRRISNVIAEDLATAEKPTGAEFGNALRGFYAGRAITKGPDDRGLREESATEFVGSLANIVRLNFQAASDPAVYGVLMALRRWWHPSAPPAKFEASSRKVAQAGMEALHLFARQGVRNKTPSPSHRERVRQEGDRIDSQRR